MSRTDAAPALDVRSYRVEDEPRVLALLEAAMGKGPAGERSPEFFRWKHLDNPFGPSFMLVAEGDGTIVGFRSFMRWRFQAGGRMVPAVRAVDTATHPEFQGRGVFSRLTLEALEALREEADLVFNTPNEKSLPGYLKMGWRTVGKVPISIRVRRPIRFARGLRWRGAPAGASGVRPPIDAETAAEALRDEKEVALLLDRAGGDDQLLSTPRDVEYLRWRYGSARVLDYRAVREQQGDRLTGLAIFRVRPRGKLWESTVTEVLVPRGDARTARTLLHRVVEAAGVDHVTCHFPAGSAPARGARRSGFFRSPGGMTLVVNPLRDDVDTDLTALGSWALSLGDLEVF